MATAGTAIRESCGSLTMLIVPFTAITNADTWASGLGSSIVTYTYQPKAATETGTCVALSSGTFTFYNSGVTGNGDLVIYYRG